MLSSGWFKEAPASSRIDEAAISIAKRAADSAKKNAEKVKMMNSTFNLGVGGVVGGMVPSSMSSAMQAAANAVQRLRGQSMVPPPPSLLPPGGGLYGGFSAPHSTSSYMTTGTGPPMPPALALAFSQGLNRSGGPPSLTPPAPTQAQLQAKEVAMAQARAQAKLIATQQNQQKE